MRIGLHAQGSAPGAAKNQPSQPNARSKVNEEISKSRACRDCRVPQFHVLFTTCIFRDEVSALLSPKPIATRTRRTVCRMWSSASASRYSLGYFRRMAMTRGSVRYSLGYFRIRSWMGSHGPAVRTAEWEHIRQYMAISHPGHPSRHPDAHVGVQQSF